MHYKKIRQRKRNKSAEEKRQKTKRSSLNPVKRIRETLFSPISNASPQLNKKEINEEKTKETSKDGGGMGGGSERVGVRVGLRGEG